METPTPKLARRAAVLLRAFAANFDGKTAPASIVERLGKLDLKTVADVLDRAEAAFNRTAPERLQARIAGLESELEKSRFKVKALTPSTPPKDDRTSSGEGGGFRRAWYQKRFPSRVCQCCRKHFLSSRADAKTCSPKCRVAYHRKLKANPELAAEHAGKFAAEAIPSGDIGKRKPRRGEPLSKYRADRLAMIREQKKSSDTGQWWNLPANISDGERARFEQIQNPEPRRKNQKARSR